VRLRRVASRREAGMLVTRSRFWRRVAGRVGGWDLVSEESKWDCVGVDARGALVAGGRCFTRRGGEEELVYGRFAGLVAAGAACWDGRDDGRGPREGGPPAGKRVFLIKLREGAEEKTWGGPG